jgi:GNAT superfamily N-acetyltransferase
MEPTEHHRDGFVISTEKDKLQLDEIYLYLSRSYWAHGRTREAVALSLQHSLCFGLYKDGRQMGLARVISDCATYAYLCDVYVLEDYQGRGLGKWLISTVMAHPDLQGLRRWTLATRDAHDLYRKFGFTELRWPERWMEVYHPPVVTGVDTERGAP